MVTSETSASSNTVISSELDERWHISNERLLHIQALQIDYSSVFSLNQAKSPLQSNSLITHLLASCSLPLPAHPSSSSSSFAGGRSGQMAFCRWPQWWSNPCCGYLSGSSRLPQPDAPCPCNSSPTDTAEGHPVCSWSGTSSILISLLSPSPGI